LTEVFSTALQLAENGIHRFNDFRAYVRNHIKQVYSLRRLRSLYWRLTHSGCVWCAAPVTGAISFIHLLLRPSKTMQSVRL